MDDIVISRLANLATLPIVRELALVKVEEILSRETEPLSQERKKLEAELGRLPSMFTNWADRLDRGVIDEHQFAHRNKQLLAQKANITKRLAEIDEALARRNQVENELQCVQKALNDFGSLWEHGTLDERKEVVRLLVEKLEITRESVTIKARYMPEEVVPLPSMRGKWQAKTARRAPPTTQIGTPETYDGAEDQR